MNLCQDDKPITQEDARPLLWHRVLVLLPTLLGGGTANFIVRRAFYVVTNFLGACLGMHRRPTFSLAGDTIVDAPYAALVRRLGHEKGFTRRQIALLAAVAPLWVVAVAFWGSSRGIY